MPHALHAPIFSVSQALTHIARAKIPQMMARVTLSWGHVSSGKVNCHISLSTTIWQLPLVTLTVATPALRQPPCRHSQCHIIVHVIILCHVSNVSATSSLIVDWRPLYHRQLFTYWRPLYDVVHYQHHHHFLLCVHHWLLLFDFNNLSLHYHK